jgi:diguanylate cyclase (GGDEF)-like protein
MLRAMRVPLLRSIANHPLTSAQDAILAVSVLAIGLLLAVEFDLFSFAHELTTHERQITLMEAIALTVLLALCLAVFIVRRVREEQLDLQQRDEIDAEMRELRYQATRDELTSLPNRRVVFSRLKELDPEIDGRCHAFFLLDLNGFKRVNDRYGHPVGDNLLLVVAERLKRATRPADLLARLGGDEFAVLAHDVDYAEAQAVGRRYIVALNNEIWLDGVGYQIGVSIGAVLIPHDCTGVEEVLANADVAMYRAKDSGGSGLVFYCDLEQNISASSA